MVKVSLCFIVYVYIFIYVGNTCVVVTGSLSCFAEIKNWETVIQRSASILDN